MTLRDPAKPLRPGELRQPLRPSLRAKLPRLNAAIGSVHDSVDRA